MEDKSAGAHRKIKTQNKEETFSEDERFPPCFNDAGRKKGGLKASEIRNGVFRGTVFQSD
jgi:hypothetical protein